jgi:hypothetical protein
MAYYTDQAAFEHSVALARSTHQVAIAAALATFKSSRATAEGNFALGADWLQPSRVTLAAAIAAADAALNASLAAARNTLLAATG